MKKIYDNKGFIGKLFIGIGISLVVAIVLPISLAFILFFDNSKNPKEYQKVDLNNYFKDVLVSSLNDTKDTKKINISINEQDINNLLHSTLTKENGIPTDVISQIYIDIKDDQYIFNLGVRVTGFATKIKLYTELKAEKIEGEDYYTFAIKNCKIGRTSNLTNIAFKIVSNYVSNEDIKNALEKNGLHMEVNLKEGFIKYKEADILNDINAFVNKNDSNNLLFSIMDDFLKLDYLTLDFNSKISASIDLVPFQNDPNGFLTKEKEQNLSLDESISKLKTLYANGIIESEKFSNVYQYFIYGYNNSDDETKAYLSTKDLSSIGISNVQDYEGIIKKENKPLSEIIGDKVQLSDLLNPDGFTFMSEDEANEYIAGKGFIGYSYLLCNSTNEIINYITVDNYYCNIFNKNDIGYLSIVAGINFNGCETYVIYSLKNTSSDKYKMTFSTENIFFGQYNSNDNLGDFLFNLMASSLEGDSTIKIDYASRNITIDFESSFSQEVKDAIDAAGEPYVYIEGDSINSDGRVVAKIK